MYQTIRLKFDEEERTLTTFEYGRKIYNEQVKDIINLDYNIPIVFCFPKNIVKVSSSFVQGLFKDILDKIGYVGFEKRIIISSRSEILSKYIRQLIW